MAEQADESQETLIPDEETVREPEPDPTDSDVDVEALKAKAAKADEYKKYADRVAAENKELKKKPTEPNLNNSSPVTRQDLERIDLKTEGFTTDQVDFIMRNGGRSALEDPLVQAAIEAQKKKQKSQEATPSGTNKSPVYQKYTEGDLKRLSLEELEKIVPQE